MRYRVFRLDFHTKRHARSLKPSGAWSGRSGHIRPLSSGETEGERAEAGAWMIDLQGAAADVSRAAHEKVPLFRAAA